MGHYKTLHSGEHWQMLRRAKAARLARAAEQALVRRDDGDIYTFVPGRVEPIRSVLHVNGSLVPISGLSPGTKPAPRPPKRAKVAARAPSKSKVTNSAFALAMERAAAEDELLLARLSETPAERAQRKRSEEGARGLKRVRADFHGLGTD